MLDKGDAEDLHFRCMSHVLNLGAQDIMSMINYGMTKADHQESNEEVEEDSSRLEPVGKIVTKIRNSFVKIRRSKNLRKKLQSCCDVEKIAFLEPVLDVKTR